MVFKAKSCSCGDFGLKYALRQANHQFRVRKSSSNIGLGPVLLLIKDCISLYISLIRCMVGNGQISSCIKTPLEINGLGRIIKGS